MPTVLLPVKEWEGRIGGGMREGEAEPKLVKAPPVADTAHFIWNTGAVARCLNKLGTGGQ